MAAPATHEVLINGKFHCAGSSEGCKTVVEQLKAFWLRSNIKGKRAVSVRRGQVKQVA